MVCTDAFKQIKGFELKINERRGRFPEEKVIEFYIGYRGLWGRLLIVKFFDGRPPFYRRWIEVFSISSQLNLHNTVYTFIESAEEKKLVECLSRYIGPGERLFIEYIYDRETWKALEIGVPIPLTRLGFMLLQNGFTWFKDWYFPEGFMEGNPKLQAEKPLDDNLRKKHVSEICMEVLKSIERLSYPDAYGVYRDIVEKAFMRAKNIYKLCG